MRNHGTAPLCDLVDLRFRNGDVARSVKPSSYRWSIGDCAYPANYAFDIIGKRPDVGRVYGLSAVIIPSGTLFFVDTHLLLDPTAEQVAEMVLLAAEEVRGFGITRVVRTRGERQGGQGGNAWCNNWAAGTCDQSGGFGGTGVTAHVLSWVYLAFLVFVPASLGLALVLRGRAGQASWYVTALCLNWALGTASYYVLPSRGPIYAQPALFWDLPETGVSRLQDSLLTSRWIVLGDPDGTDRLNSIAAFASLHTSIIFTAALIAQFVIASVAIRTALWSFFALTALATIYFGWHYVLDNLAGMLIGYVAVVVGGWATGQRRRGNQAVVVAGDTEGSRSLASA